MRKEVLLTIASGLLYSSTALSQTCATPPSCESLGFTETEADCAGGKMLKCPFDLSKVFCGGGGDNSDVGAKPGDIYYSDGTFSEDVISGKTAVGIVAYVNGTNGFVVALDEPAKTWGGQGYNVACLPNISSVDTALLDDRGKANTQCLLSDSQPHPAAEYCNSYKPVTSGKGSSGWYLPAAGELNTISLNYRSINLGLQKLSKTQSLDAFYWSSSEDDSNGAWNIRLSDGYNGGTGYAKYYTRLVCCVLEF